MPDHMLSIEEAKAKGFPLDPLKFMDCTHLVDEKDHEAEQRFFQSRWYFVIRTEIITANDLEMTWLSIRRNDRKALQDWRHLQTIKNELTSPTREAVQLYPTEERVMDESNQMHLWVYPEEHFLPFGYATRSVLTATELQREYEFRKEQGLITNMPQQRAFDSKTEAASRSIDELREEYGEGHNYTHTYHRRKLKEQS